MSSAVPATPTIVTCQICSKAPQRYCCPRCNTLYCSIICYRAEAHVQCAENFYKECVVQEMSQQPDTSDSVRRMYETLQRMEDQNSKEGEMSDLYGSDDANLDSDDDDYNDSDDDLSERLAHVDLNDANAVWEKLTPKERNEFEILCGGDISLMLPITTDDPWWTCKQTKVLIEEVASPPVPPNNTATTTLQSLPPLYTKIVDFAKISNKPPAFCVPHNLINVLAAYVITFRYFNGDHLDSAREATNHLMAACANLRKNANFDDDKMAIHSAVFDCQNACIEIGQAPAIRKDVDDIVEGPISKHPSNIFVLAALSDVHRMFSAAAKSMRQLSKIENDAGPNEVTIGEFSKRFEHKSGQDCVKLSTVTSCLKKIEYYLAYVKKFR